ncbi:hypothetical protein [Bradyrhizobium sp. S69]|uniref:hypothetical protein n=1 Tax=Bradyrhizobium sp. S69 TaxID=1641856 RepID=UPI00131C29D6|nr:hypothetical protein [Bradyrhizobium sp. S69]
MSPRPTERVTLHFDLSHFAHLPADQEFTVRGHRHRPKLQRHSDATRQAHARRNRALAAMPADRLARITHFCENLEVASDAVSLHWIGYRSRNPNALADIIAVMYQVVPAAHVRRAVRAMQRDGGPAAPALLERCGLVASAGVQSGAMQSSAMHADDMHVDAARVVTPEDSAITLVMQHPEILSLDPSVHHRVKEKVVAKCRTLSGLWRYISLHDADGSDPWYVYTIVRDAAGNVMSPAADLKDHEGNPLDWHTTVVDGKTVQVILHQELAPAIDDAVRPVVQEALRELKQQPWLKGRNWMTGHGITVVDRAPGVAAVAAVARADADAAVDWTIKTITSQYGLDVDDGSLSYAAGLDGNPGTLSFNVTNRGNRWLAVYTQAFDASGTAVTDKTYLDMIGPGNCMFGEWLPTDSTGLSFDMPDKATRVDVLLGGLGHGHADSEVDQKGILCTAFISYGMPALLLLATVGFGGKKWWIDFFSKTSTRKALIDIGAVAFGVGLVTLDTKAVLIKAGETCSGVLLSWALNELALYICGYESMQNLVDSAPVIGVGLRIAGCSASVGDMAATTADVARSPATYTLEIKRSMTLNVTVKPDPTHGRSGENPIWPKVADHWVITVQYRGGTTLRKAGPMPGKDDGLITATFSKATEDELPSAPGDQFQIIAEVYSRTNWMAGQWVSGWITAVPTDGDTRSETGSIIEQLVKLTEETTYVQREKLAYDGQTTSYLWSNIIFSLPGALADALPDGAVPQALIDAFWTKSVRLAATATVAGGGPGQWTVHDPAVGVDYALLKTPITDDDGKVVDYELEVNNVTHAAPTGTVDDLSRQDVTNLVGITINNLAYRIGYCYQAGKQNLPLDYGTTPVSDEMHLIETLSTLADPAAGLKEPTRGFARQPCIAFDQFFSPGLFQLKPAMNFMPELDAFTACGPVPDDIAKTFAANRLPLPEGATVVAVIASASWRIASAAGQALFDLRRQVDVIKVFNAPAPEFSGNNFYLDTRTYEASGLSHIRRVDLGENSEHTFDYNTGKSWGSFVIAKPDAMIIHPNGYAIAVSFDDHQMTIVKLPDDGVDDSAAPPALPFSGYGVREGLMKGPIAVTVSADGRILVLEKVGARVQAFDTFGNPVQCFGGALTFGLDAGLQADLDHGRASTALIQALQQQVPVNPSAPERTLLTPLTNLPTSFTATLDSGTITSDLHDALTNAGLALYDGATVTRTADSLWLLADGAGATYDLRHGAEGLDEIDVYRGWSLDIDVKAPGSEWLIRDRTNTLTFDVQKASGLQARQLISVMALKDPVSASVIYLDIAIETKGFIYVLSYLPPDSGDLSPSDYRLDIYNPDGSPLTPDPNEHNGQINAARMTVDQWRTVFSLNYEQMQGPSGRPEPTISQWMVNI